MPDKFPQAFKRFETQVDISNVRDYRELREEFKNWSLAHWIGSNAQNEALKLEAEKRHISDVISIRHYFVLRRGREYSVWRDSRGRFVKR